MSGHASGQPLPSISFEVIDHFGNLVSGKHTTLGFSMCQLGLPTQLQADMDTSACL